MEVFLWAFAYYKISRQATLELYKTHADVIVMVKKCT
jgi:hypothetical protein